MNWRTNPSVMLVLVVGLVCSPRTSLAEVAAQVDRFKIEKFSSGLLVPIELDGKTYLFCVDTGSSLTVFDLKLLRDIPPKGTWAKTPSGPVFVSLHNKVPAAKLGVNNLQDELSVVGGVNLVDVRKTLKKEIYGILGMDFLRSRVMEINFDEHELLLSRNPPGDRSKDFLPISFTETGHPTVAAAFVNQAPMQFTIDTGMLSRKSGTIGKRPAHDLIGHGGLKVTDVTTFQSLAGNQSERVLQGHLVTLGMHQIPSPIFTEGVDDSNVLSLYCLSRFHVTLDFPNKRMYLQKGRDFGKSDVAESRSDSETAKGTDEKPDSRDGDIVVKINGVAVDQIPPSTLLQFNGKVVTLLILHGNQQIEVVEEFKLGPK